MSRCEHGTRTDPGRRCRECDPLGNAPTMLDDAIEKLEPIADAEWGYDDLTEALSEILDTLRSARAELA